MGLQVSQSVQALRFLSREAKKRELEEPSELPLSLRLALLREQVG